MQAELPSPSKRTRSSAKHKCWILGSLHIPWKEKRGFAEVVDFGKFAHTMEGEKRDICHVMKTNH